MITFHTEAWSDALPEISKFWPEHWREVALHQEEIPLDPDFDEYARIEKAGQLHVTVVRHSGKVVGYAVVIIRRHLHYRRSLSGYFDLYFLAPAHRRGWTGVRLFRHVEKAMRQRGVERLFTGTKLSLDASKIFERLGWEETERLHTKLLKE